MLVANQDSNYISVFKRDPVTGALAEEGKNFPVRYNSHAHLVYLGSFRE